MRLSPASLDVRRAGVRIPAYDRGKVTTGIVHFGPGAFHRAHQAAYVDDLLAQDPNWGICGVSLRSTDVTDALAAQGSLYTLAIADETPSYRVLGPHRSFITAHRSADKLKNHLA